MGRYWIVRVKRGCEHGVLRQVIWNILWQLGFIESITDLEILKLETLHEIVGNSQPFVSEGKIIIKHQEPTIELTLERALTDAMPNVQEGECHCDKWLSTYIIFDLPEDDLPVGDWCRNYQAIVYPEDRLPGILPLGERRTIKAFTVADAQRLVEWEFGEELRKPRHRILELIDGEWEELTKCSVKPSQELKDFWAENRRRFLERNRNDSKDPGGITG